MSDGRLHMGHAALAILALALLAGLALVAGGWNAARSDPVLRRATLTLPDWPADAPPLRVALLSDIHMGNATMDPARLTRIVAQVNAARPDLVLLAGDYVVGHKRDIAPLKAPLARLRAPLGTVAVLGNHDNGTGEHEIRATLESAGITVLDNQAVERGPVTIVGIGDLFSHHARIEEAMLWAHKLPRPWIALTHSPDVAPRLPPELKLLLAGHTHCAQILLPLLDPVHLLPALGRGKPPYDPRYRCGIIHDPDRTVLVTAGIGTTALPLRIGAPPDWWLITLTGPEPRH